MREDDSVHSIQNPTTREGRHPLKSVRGVWPPVHVTGAWCRVPCMSGGLACYRGPVSRCYTWKVSRT